jgi:DNA replication licensing factor MCM3
VCEIVFYVFRLLAEAFQELIALQRALKEFVASADPIYSKQHEAFFVGFVGRYVSAKVTC